eukprot:TRINITY_DN6105_c0_g1_i2.p3 TRINITY_DN6105_c0_g1~~TRINITY_DN6105_c0_g1_i2.p3  ORF type:complete len:149 (-),score=46.59 TRINITY_DN6105_c0_g1_i2:168-614(-)
MYPDSLPLMEELEGRNKLPAFCELMDKRTQVASKRLSRPFPDPLYRTVVQTPMTSLTTRRTEIATPAAIQQKSRAAETVVRATNPQDYKQMILEYTQRFGKGKHATGFSRAMLDEAMNYHESVKMRKIEANKYEQRKHMLSLSGVDVE